jgi:hypothetical protein
MTHNENRASLDRVAIDKNIQPIARAGTEMPGGLLSMTPLNSNPHGAPVPPSAAADTTAVSQLGPVTPGGMPRQTPPGAKISPDVRAALPRQADGVERRVNEFLRRK